MVLALVLPGWAATYYTNGSGAPYTDPQGKVWGIGDDGNPGTMAAPKATIAGGCGLVTVNNDNLKIAPATYTVSAPITITLADRAGIIIEGVDPNNMPVIDGSGLAAENTGLLQLRGETTVRYLNFIHVNKTSGYANVNYALYDYWPGATIKIDHCRFERNRRDIMCRGASSYEIYDCKFIATQNCSIATHEDFKTAGSNLLIHYNKFYGYMADVGAQNYIMLNGTDGAPDPTASIYNNIFAGGGTDSAVIINTSFDGTVNIKNNVFTGNRSWAINFGEAAGATRNVSHNAYVGPAEGTLTTLNCSDSSPINDQTLYMGNRGTGYLIIRKDDSYDSTTVNLDYTEMLAAKMAARGLRLTVSADYAGAQIYGTMTQLKRIADTYNAEIACHGYSHASLDNDSTHLTPFTVQYTGAGTCNLVITSTGSAPNDAETLTLTESISGDNISINLVTGAITGDTTFANLTTWKGLRDYLDNKSYLVCSTISETIYTYPSYTLSRTLGPVTLNGLVGPSNISLNKNRFHYYEMVYPKALFQANGINLSNTFTYPSFLYDAGTITDLGAYGYTAALGTVVGVDWKIGQQLEKLQMYELAAT